MHELAVCQDIISQVESIALTHHASSVEVINLQIGPLSGIQIKLLESAFSIAKMGTVAENTLLNIEPIPVTVKCNICNTRSEVKQNNLQCKHCGNKQTQLISGDEMLLRQIELETDKSTVEH